MCSQKTRLWASERFFFNLCSDAQCSLKFPPWVVPTPLFLPIYVIMTPFLQKSAKFFSFVDFYFYSFSLLLWLGLNFQTWVTQQVGHRQPSDTCNYRAKSTDRDKLTAKKYFVTWFCHWFRRSDFVTKWGFGQDGYGDSKNLFRIALLTQSAFFAVSCRGLWNYDVTMQEQKCYRSCKSYILSGCQLR